MKRIRTLLLLLFLLPPALLGMSGCAGENGEPEAGAAPAVEETADDAEHMETEGEHEGDAEHEEGEADHDHEHDAEAEVLSLPELAPVNLDGGRLRVVATTSIIGDVVARVGGEAIELTTLMESGQDPHSFEPGARDLTTVADAHVIFVNGWDLEEGLADDLDTISAAAPLVPISAGIEPLAFGEHGHDEDEHEDEAEHEDEHGHDHDGADPHVWFSIHSVEQWVENVVTTLSGLDPERAEQFAANGAAYQAELAELEEYVESRLAEIPAERRLLVTNHESLNYLARDFGFELVGTVIPAASTVAEPSASALAELVETMEASGVCTIFTETTFSDDVAQTVAAELDGCAGVQVLSLYTGAVGPAGSNADSYIGMYRANVDTLVAGLAQ